MPFDLEALARSIEERDEGERRRRAAMQLPEATTVSGQVFRYIPLRRGDQAHGCSDDYVFMCRCQFVAVILTEASKLTDNARAARMHALGWKPTDDGGVIWRCPDCVALWEILGSPPP